MNTIINNLNTDSKNLLKIVKKINFHYNTSIYKNDLIKKIYKITKNNINNQQRNYKITSKLFIYEEYKHLLDFDFISNKIKNNIKNKIKNTYIINYNNTQLTLLSNYKNLNKNVKKIINNILNVIEILRNCFKNNKYLNINLFLSSPKKRFPSNNKIISSENCNSGLTYYPSNDNGIIVIFRKEEYIKVLIHECIHALRGDELLWDKANNKKIFNKYCLNLFEYNKININETYTEFLASIFNQIYIINYLKLPIKIIDKIFKYESIYSLLKVKQILNHYNYTDINKLYNSKKCKVFNQKTSVLSYYIFKTALYFNPINTLNFYNNCSNNFKIKFSCLNDFIELIIKSNDVLLLKIINQFTLKNITSKSLRMTLFELK